MVERDYTPRLWCDGAAHLREVGGYWNHFKFGGIATLWLIAVIFSSVIHILIPHLLPFVADDWICKLGERSMKPRGWVIDKGQRKNEDAS